MCEQLDTPCVIDLTLDMRRRTALQRTMEESRAFQDTLNGVIGILRSGDRSEIQALITHIQSAADEDDLLETLQTELQTRGKTDGLRLGRQIKDEEEESLNFGSDDEGESWKSESVLTPGLSRKRTHPSQEDEKLRPSISPIQSGGSESREGDSLASTYLPLLSKLRTISDHEATRILHDLRTSPVNSEGVAALNLLERRHSRPNLNLQTSQSPTRKHGTEMQSVDRLAWHPSLQVTRADLHAQVASTSSQGQWGEQTAGRYTGQVC